MRLWTIAEFRFGFAAGTVALLAVLACILLAPKQRSWHSLPVGGLALSAAALLSVGRYHSVPLMLVVAVVGLACAAETASFPDVPAWAPYVLSIPSGLAIGFLTGLPRPLWVRALVAVVASAGAMVVATTDHEWRHEAPTLALFALTAGGMYFAVPDTEEAAALLGAALPLVVLGWPLRLATLGRSGAAAATAVFVWVAAVDARGRLPSLLGSVACLGLLIGLALGRALLGPKGDLAERHPRTTVLAVMGVVQIFLVSVASRVAGVSHDVATAASVAVLVGAMAVLAGAAFPALETPPALDEADATDGTAADHDDV